MSPSQVTLAEPAPPGLQEATKNSTVIWQQHLVDLFHHTKDRFPDVVWDFVAEDDEENIIDEVWGHKAIVYARAPPSFQSRYFSFKPNSITSATPYSSSPSPYPTQSALSLALEVPNNPSSSRTPSPFRPSTPPTVAPNNATLLRISTSINSTLFSNELEYLYTGQGFGEAFEFLFDSSDSRDPDIDPDTLRVDKLRKDLVFMWRSRLYSDVRISLTGNFSSSHSTNDHTETTAIFSSHRFILVSRSPYFYSNLINFPPKPVSGESPILTLPAPPFTPASLHFTLGFIYTGTLIFSHRTYDLSTAFAILRAALYLSITTLHDEIQARIAHEMCHGLFHAFLSFPEYERLTQSKWGTGGCRCRQCARRAPRVLEFAIAPDVRNTHLERGARRALVGLFGEGWCTPEFTSLDQKLRESILKGVSKRTTPQNVFPLLFAAEHALAKLGPIIESWADIVRDMILSARKHIDEVICKEAEACFASDEWMEFMEADGDRFDDAERVQWAMTAVLRGVKEPWAATLYQTLVSSILLKPHPTEPNTPFLSSTSKIRQLVEQTRVEVLKWVTKRWIMIRQEHGFDSLEDWAIQEISDYMEVPTEDLLNPVTHNSKPSPRNKSFRPVSNHPHTSRIDTDSDAASSIRVSVLSRNLAPKRPGPSVKDNASVRSSASSIRSVRTTMSSTSAASDNTIGRTTRTGNGMSPARQIVQATRARDAAAAMKDRPDSKLTPASPTTIGTRSTSPVPGQPTLNLLPPEDDGDQKSVISELSVTTETQDDDETDKESVANSETAEPDITPARQVKKTIITRTSLASVSSRTSNNAAVRPISSSASIRSQTSILRKTSGGPSPSTTRGKPSTSSTRPVSRASVRSTSTTSKTATSTTTTSSRSTATSNFSRSASGSSTSSTNRMSSVTTESGATFRTASSGPSTPGARSRKSSTATLNARTTGPGPSSVPNTSNTSRVRKVSTASVSSISSNTGSSAYGTAKSSASRNAAPPVPVVDPKKLSPAAIKSSKPASIRSVKSSSSLKKATLRVSSAKTSPASSTPVSPVISKTPDVKDIKDTPAASEHKKTESTTSTSSAATIKKKRSNETIVAERTRSAGSVDKSRLDKPQPPLPKERGTVSVPRGATLEVGIPCIISSKRKRFKAYARYIGEVEGESGPWVGVEVPIPLGESWADRDVDSGWKGTQWNDGSWGGIRYFEIGNRGAEDYGTEDRATRRRRVDGGSTSTSLLSKDKNMLKREGDQLNTGTERMKRLRTASPTTSDSYVAESRGLFVRPQQVLYVIDAEDR